MSISHRTAGRKTADVRNRTQQTAACGSGLNVVRLHPTTAKHREIAQRYRRGKRPVSKLERILALRGTQLARAFKYRGGLHDDGDGPQAGPGRYLARLQEARRAPQCIQFPCFAFALSR
jgi:hypothetical protein